jgi:hypothetical protein
VLKGIPLQLLLSVLELPGINDEERDKSFAVATRKHEMVT